MSYKTPKRHTMDYKKDIKGNMLVSQAPSSVATTFGVTLSKKCERLATAVYLVTNFLSDSEPLKSRLRSLSVDFVRDASFVRYGGQATETSVLDALRANIGETLSLLELALIAGLVSEMNFTILKREYATLRDSIDIKKASRESRTDSILGDNFFGTPEPARPHPKGQTFESADPCLGHKRNPSPRPDLSGSAPASSLRGGTTKQSSTRPHSPFPVQHSVRIESRRARILKLVKDNREVTIKDIATHFVDLSEKTIQRELVSLVESGVLKKFGERRWSRYALA